MVCFSTLSVPVMSNGRMIPGLGRVWKETVMLSSNCCLGFRGKTETTTANVSQTIDIGRDSNWALFWYRYTELQLHHYFRYTFDVM